ncbi:hypothetical protein AMTRI_Chr13g119220 [Amborella trichopoda]
MLALECTLHLLLPLKAAGEAGTSGLKTILWALVTCVGSPPTCSSVKLPQLWLICILKNKKKDEIQNHNGECDK